MHLELTWDGMVLCAYQEPLDTAFLQPRIVVVQYYQTPCNSNTQVHCRFSLMLRMTTTLAKHLRLSAITWSRVFVSYAMLALALFFNHSPGPTCEGARKIPRGLFETTIILMERA